MPNIVAALNNLESSVERPVIYDIIRQVMNYTQISSKTNIRFYGDEGKAAQKNSTITQDGKGENRWGHDQKLVIEVDEDFEVDRMLSTAVKEAENIWIFRDAALHIGIKPVYTSCAVTVRFKYRARDKNEANRWRNEMRVRTSMMREVNLHSLTYHYEFPPKFQALLKEIHSLREEVAGYNEDFLTYFTKNTTTRASIVSSLDGKNPLWAVGDTQGRVQGQFQFAGVPDKPEKDGDGDAWNVSFSYIFHYDKPVHCAMFYPLVVHQQLLSEDWRPAEKITNPGLTDKTYTLSAKNFSKFETDRQMEESLANDGLDLPDFDEFIPRSIVPSTLRIFTALSSLTEEDKRSLYNLSDLGENFALDEDIQTFIRESEYPFMGKPYHSILCMSLYEDHNLQGSNAVVIDADLDVKAAKDLDLRKTYRTRLSMVGDISLLTQDARDRLKDYPNAAIKIGNAINAALSNKGGQKDLGKNQLSPWDLDQIGLHYNCSGGAVRQQVRGAVPPQPGNMRVCVIVPGRTPSSGWEMMPGSGNGQNVRFNTVQTLFVAARPRSAYPKDVPNQDYRPNP